MLRASIRPTKISKTSEAALTSDVSILFQNFHDVSSRCPTDPASAMDSASAQIQIINWRFVIRPAWNWAHEQELIEHELTVIDVAFGETVGLFEVERGDGFTIYD